MPPPAQPPSTSITSPSVTSPSMTPPSDVVRPTSMTSPLYSDGPDEQHDPHRRGSVRPGVGACDEGERRGGGWKREGYGKGLLTSPAFYMSTGKPPRPRGG